MSDIILKTENLGVSFGGLKAAQNVNIEIKKNQIYGLILPIFEANNFLLRF